MRRTPVVMPALTALALLTTACATTPRQPIDGTRQVRATVETTPVATGNDAADDPAIWRNAADPARSLIVATDKKAGLHVYELDGSQRQFLPAARLNNVDLRADLQLGGEPAVIVAASDRSQIDRAQLALFLLAPASGELRPLATVPVGNGEAYGSCLYRRAADAALFAFVVDKDGNIVELALDLSGRVPQAKAGRRFKLGSQSEGCVVDDRTGLLYVGEEDVGIWRIDLNAGADPRPVAFARVDDRNLVADVEGLALAPQGERGGWLIASSQGDSSYIAYRLDDGRPVGRFQIVDGAVDGTRETDGIELMLGDFGPQFPDGLFVAQDGDNAPDLQNFKLVPWQAIRAVLGGSP